MSRLFLRNLIIHAVLLMGLWVLLSGHYDLFHLTLGVLSVASVMALNFRLRNYQFFKEEVSGVSRLRIRRLVFYIPWLIWQIVISSLQVAYVVLHPRVPVDPTLLRFKTGLPNVGARVILGNSITLTPGTLTLLIKDEEFLVHALMEVSASGIISGLLPGQVARLYMHQPENVVTELEEIKTVDKV